MIRNNIFFFLNVVLFYLAWEKHHSKVHMAMNDLVIMNTIVSVIFLFFKYYFIIFFLSFILKTKFHKTKNIIKGITQWIIFISQENAYFSSTYTYLHSNVSWTWTKSLNFYKNYFYYRCIFFLNTIVMIKKFFRF